MTAFITPCCTNGAERSIRRLLVALLWLPAWLLANDTALRHAEIKLQDDAYVVNAEIDVELNPRLTEAVNHGVSLYFVTELRVERPRWYWFDEVVIERRLNYRISYHAITRSYRLSLGSFHQSFDTLDDALRIMRRVRNWEVAERAALIDGESYEASLRFRLDTAQLPKPFQVTAIGSSDWNLSTDWLKWTFLAGPLSQ
ncbi:DUF4390 domain-containing protein [Zoogloeaceae bacteirum Par-f-2]|jgi:hypothetical protein|uniref:DUF4390 domain-containing protein n=1 Tax=Pseudothauera hydrothermalis TaxID=2184083 RepID=UPI000C799318|nr:DUF4390 domain-containing protein [Pseudothauera hydrothermalis]AUM01323.1 hypothetical protein B4966_15030 [Rhodocyclaceae bacterium]AVZ80479.1 DUF4390 domain-containing protein [Zoogloeaceae bacteirum Par-f-2]